MLLLATGCGSAEKTAGGGASGDAGSVAEDAAQNVALTSDNFIETVTEAQLEAGSTHVEMTIGSQGQSIEASGDLEIGDDPTDTAMTMTMTMPGMGEMDMRLVDQVLYMNMGQMTQDKFAKIDLSDPSNPAGKSFEDMVGQMDPSKSLQNFEGAIKSVETDGETEEIDGVETQPHTVVIDTTKVAEDAGGLGGGAASLPDEISYTFWVGTADNLPRKMTMDVAGAAIEMTFSKWGEDVDVEAPPADQITEQSPLSQMPSAGPTG